MMNNHYFFPFSMAFARIDFQRISWERGGNRCRIEGPEFMYPRAQLRFYKCYICRPSNEEPTSSFFIYIYINIKGLIKMILFLFFPFSSKGIKKRPRVKKIP